VTFWAAVVNLLFGSFFFSRTWMVLEVVIALMIVLLILVGIERLLAPWYYSFRTRREPDRMTPLHGGGDTRNENLSGIISVPDVEETIKATRQHDIKYGRNRAG
jgi:hypothetical protein